MDDSKKFKSNDSARLFGVLSEGIKYGTNDIVQSMLQFTKSHHLVDDSGSTLLHRAAEYGNEVMVQYLINNECAVDALNLSRKTPLMLALDSGSIRCMEILLEAKAAVFSVSDDTGFNVLQQVFCCPSLLIAKEILGGTVDLELYNCLTCGSEMLKKFFQLDDDRPKRSHDVINLFLKKVNEICFGNHLLVARTLMQVGCSLVKAINLRNPEVIKIMLESGMHVNEDDCDTEETALHVAVELLDFELVKLLVQHGAKVNARGTNGETPIRRYPMDIDETSDGPRIFKLLIDNGASLTVEDNLFRTPISEFLTKENQFVARTVIEHVANLSAKDGFGTTPICYLTMNENPGVLEVVRGRTFDENEHKHYGLTPLFLAITFNYDLEKVKFWLAHGANVNSRDNNGNTPMVVMFQKSHNAPRNIMEIITTLLRHEADVQCLLKNDMTIFDYVVQNNFYFRAKPVIAHLIVRESLGEPIQKYIREKIDANCILKKYFRICQQQIKKLKSTTVHGSVTLMKLLIESEERITLYARNPDFFSRFERKMMEFGLLDSYVENILRERVDKAINLAQIQGIAAFDICRITGLTFSANYTILYKIIYYLDNQDLENLQLV